MPHKNTLLPAGKLMNTCLLFETLLDLLFCAGLLSVKVRECRKKSPLLRLTLRPGCMAFLEMPGFNSAGRYMSMAS